MENKKVGRAITSNPRGFVLSVRLNKEEMDMLIECGELYNMSNTEIVRKAIKKMHKSTKENKKEKNIEETFKVIITGGQDFNDYPLLYNSCTDYLKKINNPIEIVTRRLEGADFLGREFANELGYDLTTFVDIPPIGQSIEDIINEMISYADMLIIFYNGRDKNIGKIITAAIESDIIIRVINH